MNAAKKRQISNASKRTWARANKLADLAGIKPTAARNFLVGCNDELKALLDNGTDLRNKALRNLIASAAAAAQSSVPEECRSSCCNNGGIQVTEGGHTYIATPINEPIESKMLEVPLDLIYDIKNLVDKYGVDTVTQGLGVYLFLKG